MAEAIQDVLSGCANRVSDERERLGVEVAKYLRSLPDLLDHLDETHKIYFKQCSPSDLNISFTEAAEGPEYNGVKGHALLKTIVDVVREDVVIAIAQLRTIYEWVNLHVPSCETGNNFGVEVQEMVLKNIREAKKTLEDTTAALPDYFKGRAESIARFGDEVTTDKDSQQINETNKTKTGDDPEKTEVKSLDKTTTTSKTKSHRTNKDWPQHVIAYDVHWYFKLRAFHKEIRGVHIAVCDLVVKNVMKLLDPRNNTTGRPSEERGGMLMY